MKFLKQTKAKLLNSQIFNPTREPQSHLGMKLAAYGAKKRAEDDEKCAGGLSHATGEYLRGASLLLKVGKTRNAVRLLDRAIDDCDMELGRHPDFLWPRVRIIECLEMMPNKDDNAFANWKKLGEKYMEIVNAAPDGMKREVAERAYELFFNEAEALENRIKKETAEANKKNQKYESDGKYRLLGLLYGFAGEFAPEDKPGNGDITRSPRDWAYAFSLLYYIKHGADYEGIIDSYRKLGSELKPSYGKAALEALLNTAEYWLGGAGYAAKDDLKIAAKVCGYAWKVFGDGTGFEDHDAQKIVEVDKRIGEKIGGKTEHVVISLD